MYTCVPVNTQTRLRRLWAEAFELLGERRRHCLAIHGTARPSALCAQALSFCFPFFGLFSVANYGWKFLDQKHPFSPLTASRCRERSGRGWTWGAVRRGPAMSPKKLNFITVFYKYFLVRLVT